MTYTIDDQLGLVVVVARGGITDEEALATFDAVMADPRFRPGMSILHDNRELETVVTPAFVKAFVARIERSGDLLRGSRSAFVESGSARYGMARMASALSESTPIEIRVFRDIDEARRWLLSPAAEE
jgi:hypothetical protein